MQAGVLVMMARYGTESVSLFVTAESGGRGGRGGGVEERRRGGEERRRGGGEEGRRRGGEEEGRRGGGEEEGRGGGNEKKNQIPLFPTALFQRDKPHPSHHTPHTPMPHSLVYCEGKDCGLCMRLMLRAQIPVSPCFKIEGH